MTTGWIRLLAGRALGLGSARSAATVVSAVDRNAVLPWSASVPVLTDHRSTPQLPRQRLGKKLFVVELGVLALRVVLSRRQLRCHQHGTRDDDGPLRDQHGGRAERGRVCPRRNLVDFYLVLTGDGR